MKLIADYHTHTYYSDGRSSVEQNVCAAIARGLHIIAITDHGPGHILNGVRARRSRLRDEIAAAQDKHAGEITVLRGIEANILDLNGNMDLRDCDADEYDVIIAGYHKTALSLAGFAQFYALRPLSSRAQAAERSSSAYVRALGKYPIDIVAHLNYGANVDVSAVAEAAAKRGAAIEINCRGNCISVAELKSAYAAGANFVINSDAHAHKYIGDFEKGEKLAELAGIGEDRIVNAAGFRFLTHRQRGGTE